MTNALRAGPARPLAATVGASGVRVWGASSSARLSRTFARLDLAEVQPGDAAADATVVLAHAGWVFDEALIRALAERPGAVLVDTTGRPVAAHIAGPLAAAAAQGLDAGDLGHDLAQRLTALDLLGAYNSTLRKREPPVLERLTADNVRQVEKRLFQGSYKGVTDLVTKYVWPAPARVVTRWCALAGITPNQVTFASLLLVLAALWLFWTGQFGWGLAAAWVMTFLDTVDGKLARVTLKSSPLGNVFDHGIDLIHPPFWWAAWVMGAQAGPHPLTAPGAVIWIVVGGYVAQRVLEGIFLGAFKVEMHAWRPFDSFFRLITARRNPNLILLTLAVLAGRPDIGILAVAVWTVISFVVHLAQCVQAAAVPRGAVVSWLSR
ncbi:CDP-alcohol phosphatidyltransferase family protein [Phenylobacterium sp.]|uniref:CDP-alcohol phosphatidyltransferase family protein n=1 Tax=Phenylobacterium sp. TaxID=1871053 RepID=UPI003982D78B